jgi:CheY-like chemotaxis protein
MAPPSPVSQPSRSATRHSVLVVDDATATRSGLAELLRLLGYDAYEAKNGAEAIEVLRPGTSVVVLDLSMPGTDGYWFREQQLKNPAVADIPVIVFTGSMPGTRLHDLNVADVLLKPFSVDAMLETIERLSLDGQNQPT